MIGLLLLVAAVAYFSTINYAMRAYSRSRLRTVLSSDRGRRWVAWLEVVEPQLILSVGVARFISIIGLVGLVFHHYLVTCRMPASTLGMLEPTIVALGLLLLFGLGIPNAAAAHAGERVLAKSVPMLWLVRAVLWPLERLLWCVDFVMRRLLGKADESDEQQADLIEREILEAVSDGEAQGAVDEHQKLMIESVIELSATTVSAIMTPRTDIAGVPLSATFEQVRETIMRVGHSRIPAYEKSIDHILGVVYAKDLLHLRPGDAFDVRKCMRPVPYVPATKMLSELLKEFRQSRVQIAVVLDEYGGTAGLVTLGDILQNLVGEIDDEHNRRPPATIQRVDDDTLEVDARVPIEEINVEIPNKLPEDAEYETIGGFVFSTLGRIPARGEQFSHGNVVFQIVDAEPRRIKRLRLTVQREAPAVIES